MAWEEAANYISSAFAWSLAWAASVKARPIRRPGKTTDQYGNLTQMQVYDYPSLTTPARTYQNGYVTDSNYTNRHIVNRLAWSTVSDGAHTTTLVQNYYDNQPRFGNCPTNGINFTVTGLHEHDTSYDQTFNYRGDLVAIVTPAGVRCASFDIAGNVPSTSANGVTTAITINSSTNFAAPSLIQTNSLGTNLTWDSTLAIHTAAGPNGDTASFTYTNSRPLTTQSPHGATTSYTYNDSASPPYSIATTNGHYVQTSMDGFGRTARVLAVYNGDGTSTVSTFYDPCACSPLGKVSQVTQPYVSNQANIYWTYYHYDGLGRTTSIQAADNSTTTYVYQGNTVTVTDPAGKWKQFYMDAFGNLTVVVEPNPALAGTLPPVVPMTVAQLQAAANGSGVSLYFVTTYGYDILNHLKTVAMQRPGVTQPQIRTFNYIDPGTGQPGSFLRSASNPENGTVTYTYSNGLLASKTDAKNQTLTYQYDTYNRLTSVKLNSTQLLREYKYDTDNTGFSQNALGRLVSVTYARLGPVNVGLTPQILLTDKYSYIAPGQPGAGLSAKKRLEVDEILYWQNQLGNPQNATVTVNLDVSYSYNNEGKVTSMTYPTTTNGPGPAYNYSYDGGYRINGMTDSSANSLVQGVTYGPSNELLTINYRTNFVYPFTPETRTYNNLVQLTNLTTSGLNAQYNYLAGANNGKINSSLTNGETVTYQYDSLNRLISAQSSAGWGEQYGLDGFGNLVSKTGAGGAPQLSIGMDPNYNQIVMPGVSYDQNGNQVYNGMIYDAENRLVTPPGAPSTQYAYDARNKRSWIWYGATDAWGGNASGYRLSLYSPGGQRLGTYQIDVFNNGVGNNTNLTLQTTLLSSDLYFGGRRLAVQDRLGSVGNYYPYGENRPGTFPQDNWSFATYWRDATNNLDYADQRYYSNQYGRFMTSDPYGDNWDPSDPGSWNTYAYTEGDPVNLVDPEGTDVHFPPIVPGPKPTCLGKFQQQFFPKGDLNTFLNSEIGTLGLTAWLEWQSNGTSADIAVWRAIAGTFENRYHLSTFLKSAYGFSQGSLKSVITQGSQAWSNGDISQTSYTNTVNILNGDPNNSLCSGLIDAFQAATDIANGATDPAGDALFYASGNGEPRTFFEKHLTATMYTTNPYSHQTVLWRFWDIANPPTPPTPGVPGPRRPGPRPGPLPRPVEPGPRR